jgi:hypothetical protein
VAGWLGVPPGVVAGGLDGGGVDEPSLGVAEPAGVLAGAVAGLLLGGALPLGFPEGRGFFVRVGVAAPLDGPVDGATPPPAGGLAGVETWAMPCDG